MYKSERIGLRLTPSEKTAAKLLADLEGGLSIAALLRRLIRLAADEHGVWPPAKTSDQPISVFDKEVKMG